MVIPKSLACGTPVVATNVGGNSEYLEMVGLMRLLIMVERYDFSLKLAEKLIEILTKKLHVNASFVASWNDIISRYIG